MLIIKHNKVQILFFKKPKLKKASQKKKNCVETNYEYPPN